MLSHEEWMKRVEEVRQWRETEKGDVPPYEAALLPDYTTAMREAEENRDD